MIRSMTGFGRSEIATEQRKIIIEMKAVNHRYSDINIKMPKKLSIFEALMRSQLKQQVQRGKIDIFVTYEDYTEQNVTLKYNEELAAEYMKYLKQMGDTFQLDKDVKISSLAKMPDVFTLEESNIDEEEIQKQLEEAFGLAIKDFIITREKEGEHLKQDLLKKLEGMLESVCYIEERSPVLIQNYREKLEAKVKELLGNSNFDEGRIMTEVVLYADKICVDEEIVRLKSHITNMIQLLNEGGFIGRKLDFIAQEMNREANTILSKMNDISIVNKAIDLKTDIEKVREQIQNIE
ncbi:MAG: YicC family protein [Lachnospiraceae bacterium]|nr:YicC family protein [Lachnospiraceae bacterium]